MWSDSTQHELLKILEPKPFYFLEIGARRGAKSLGSVDPFINYVGFEPDINACQKVSDRLKLGHPFLSAQCIPKAVGKTQTHRTLYVCQNKGCTSLLKPDASVIQRYDGHRKDEPVLWMNHLRVEKEMTIETLALNSLAQELKIPSLDWLSLDTQGTELEILESAQKLVKETTLLIQIEIEIVPVYQGQPLLSEIDSWLNEQGLRLISLHNIQHVSRSLANQFNRIDQGELISIDGIYCRQDEEVEKLDDMSKYKLVLGLCSLDFYSKAYGILEKMNTPLSIKMGQELKSFYKEKNFLKKLQSTSIKKLATQSVVDSIKKMKNFILKQNGSIKNR